MPLKFSSRSKGFRVLAGSLVLSSALTLAACGEQSQDDSPAVEQAVGLAVDAPRVVVLETGTAPLRTFAYKDVPAADAEATTQEVTLEIAQGFAQSVGAAEQVDPIAPAGGDVTTMTLPISASTQAAEASEEEAIAASRDISYQVGNPDFTDLSQSPETNTAAGFILGMRATDSGQATTMSLAAPVDATDTGRALMEQYLMTFTSLPIIFPTEEVGVGAKWTVDSRVTGESTLLQTLTYTITALEGDKVELEVSVSQRPSISALDITADATATAATTEATPTTTAAPEQLNVLSSNTTSVGNLSVDLTQPLPTAGQVSWTTRVIYGGASNNTRIVQDSTSSVKFGESETAATTTISN
ncbi:hypothetical protein SFC07_01670 [Corynebacterium callunae]|uniref:hypothetical protein n=1 Tax=Corynebacterium callunae TaxID=1721 RepID=UPI0039826A1A